MADADATERVNALVNEIGELLEMEVACLVVNNFKHTTIGLICPAKARPYVLQMLEETPWRSMDFERLEG